jgi:hypothetical protein
MSNNNRKLTDLDNAQILRQQHDVESEAQRVVIVSGEVPEIKVDSSAITEAVKEGLKNSTSNKETVVQVERIEVPVIVKETVIERVEIPVIVKEVEYREIKIPIEVVKVVEIEKPVIVKETNIQVIKENTTETKYLRIIAIVELLLILSLLLFKRT